MRRRGRVVLVMVLAVTLAAVAGAGARIRHRTRATPADCSAYAGAAMVVVDTGEHTLTLCERGRAAAAHPVRLGHGGVGKTREGDGKTPLGTYLLGPPRPSVAFGTFVPIGYPTEAQRALGSPGSAVGVHGPGRAVTWAGALVSVADTTDGCVGVATDAEMASLVAWLRRENAQTIVIR